MDIPATIPENKVQTPKINEDSEPSTEIREHNVKNLSNDNDTPVNLSHEVMSIDEGAQSDLLCVNSASSQEVYETNDSCSTVAMDRSGYKATKSIDKLCTNDGEISATQTHSGNLSNSNVLETVNSMVQSQVVFLDSGIIDGQDISIPSSSVSERVDIIHGTNSPLHYSNEYDHTDSTAIDSAEKHVSFPGSLISPEDLGMSSTSSNIFPSQLTITSNQLIKPGFAVPSTSQTHGDIIRQDSLFPHNDILPANCPLATIHKKISEIEATINIMEQGLPSSSSRIIFEQGIFPSTLHENESNDFNLQPNIIRENMNSNLNETGSNATDDNQSVTMGSEWAKEKIVDIYTEDNGPKIYDTTGKFVTPPIVPKKLTKAFSSMPIFGRPNTKAQLGEFQMNKIRDFVGCGLNNQEFEALMDYCSPEHLKTGNELITMDTTSPGYGFFPMDKSLMESTNPEPELSLHRKHKLRTNRDVKNNYTKRMKYRGIRMIPLNQEDDEATPQVTIGEPLQPGHDILFRVRVYRPFKYSPIDKYLTRSRHSVFSNDIVLLGRNKLSTLRDRMMCCNDVDMRVDISETPDDLPPTTAKDVFPSGFLFINNVFYVDTRKGCLDYSVPIRRWASKNGIGNFTSKDMCNVRLDELVIKLGHPEVYMHQGSCEHLFLFSEARVLGAGDPLKLSLYPRHSALSQNQTVYCTTCAEFAAKWIVVGCAGVPFDPAFFCDKCFKFYMYKDGKKMGDFKAYLYRGNEIK